MGIRFLLGARPNCYQLIMPAFVLAATMAAIPAPVWAACVKESAWIGTRDEAGGSGGLPPVVNLNNSAFQPDGTVIASSIASFTTFSYGKNTSYAPEQVLYRCAAGGVNQLYEFFSTNEDSPYGGMYEDGARLSPPIPGAYRTFVKGMLIRITNIETGKVFSMNWQARRLTGLDTDPVTKQILVKAKNFSDVKVELLRGGNKGERDDTGTGMYPHGQPAGYIGFSGPGMNADLMNHIDQPARGHYDGWYDRWPGTVNLYDRLGVRRRATCAFDTVTPVVWFSKLTVAQLEQGEESTKPFQIQFRCQRSAPATNGVGAFGNGVNPGDTAMGLLISAANYQSAVAERLVTSANGVTYLLSDGYRTDPGMATGVGIALAENNVPMNFLSSDLVMGGKQLAGWYPVLGSPATTIAGDTINGVTSYTKTLTASLKKLPGKSVTPGKVYAKAQVVIRVQ